ncbi:MAG: DUF354 domain-containing protein [archaeon]
MKILVDLGHPAHVHLYKNIIKALEKKGHTVKVTVRDKDVAIDLLKAYEIPFQVVEKKSLNFSLISEWGYRDYKIYKISKKFEPDLFLGTLNPVIAHCAKILDKPSIIFTDYEPDSIKYPLGHYLTSPFVDTILTPTSVRYSYGPKEFKLDSFKELAYLHPNHFIPDSNVLDQIGLEKDGRFTIIRFITWGAHHDVDRSGFNLSEKMELIERLEKESKVLISSEGPLPEELKKYEISINPEDMHDLLYYANLFICDSQTMATEAALLGTPSIRCNSFVGENDFGNFIELEKKYNLMFNYKDSKKAIEKAGDLIRRSNLDKEWDERREKLLKDKIDLSSFMVWFIENYPDSFEKMKRNPEIQDRFR